MLRNAIIHIVSFNHTFDDFLTEKLSDSGHSVFCSFSNDEIISTNSGINPDIYVVLATEENIKTSFLFLSENENTAKIPVILTVQGNGISISESIKELSTCLSICRFEDRNLLLFNIASSLKNIHKTEYYKQNISSDTENFYELVNNIEYAIWISELAGNEKIIFVNHLFEKIFQRKERELTKNPFLWLEAVVEGDIKKVSSEYEAFKSGMTDFFHSTFRIFDTRKNIKWINAKCWKTKKTSGKPERITMLMQDITSGIYFQKDLRIKNHAIESAVTGIILSNSYGRIFFANNTFLNMWKYNSESEIKGRSLIDLLDNTKDKEFIVETILKKGSWIGEITAIRSDGVTFPAQVSLTMVTDENLDPNAIMASFIDISDMKTAELEIKQNLEEKKYLLSELQHRVKNSLNIVSSLIGFEISKGWADLNDLKKIRSRIYSISRLYSSLDLENSINEINIKYYIDDIISGMKESYLPENKKIKIELDSENITINQHLAMSIGLIINEITTNSLKHAFKNKQEGMINIRIKEEQNVLIINITNNGDEFPENYSIKTSVGLGMKIVTMLTEQHKGTFEFIKGEKPNFTVKIPVTYYP
ncbi:MAG: PAS domain-containing protein [Spirochaetes bacterium]|nr:PAS domain-containing protein [Spirochaetota bacterium]